jgi:molybdenum cofactor cytidylyltransferase
MIFALIPAAGESRRMGRPKLALPLGEKTVLEHVLDALRNAQVDHMLVVIGPHVAELQPIAQNAGAQVLQLTDKTPDMRTTIEHGLRWLEEHFHPGHEDSWLLVPADHPVLSPLVVRQLIQARQANPSHAIVIPTFQGRRGHPALIGWQFVEQIRQLPPDEGINSFLRRYGSELVELPVGDSDVLLDLDTPEEYETIKREWAQR